MPKFLIPLIVGLMLFALLGRETTAQSSMTFPIRLNVGSDQPYTDQSGRVYLPDREWTPETGVGYIGGYAVYGRFPSGGTADKRLYEDQRRDWQEYRFSRIPDGDYLVTLRFSEIAVFDDFGPSYTRFDVAIEGQVVLDDLNIFAQVGRNYALTRRFAVTVSDGELNVTATPIFGESRLAALEVEARSPDTVSPAVPTGLTATDNYNAVLLDWADNVEDDLNGYYIYRADLPIGIYQRLNDEPVYVSRYQDFVPTAHVPFRYRISAVDVYANESKWTSYQSAIALDEGDATLPYYRLEVPPESLSFLHSNPWSYDEVPATFLYEGRTFPVEVRYRGNWGRYHDKKSWKVKFVDESPFPGQQEINLRADYMDPSLMRSKLATELFEAASVRPRQAEHVLLVLNGEYMGVYTRAEQMDEHFLERTGRDPGASVYKAVETELMDWSRRQPSEQAYRQAFDKKTNQDLGYDDVIAFIELINDTPDETFAYELRRVFDVAGYLDYYAIVTLTGNNDFSSHNVYLLHDLTTDRWEVVPYDLDRAFYPTDEWFEMPYDTPIDRGTPGSPIWGWVTNLLLTRVLNVSQFRAYYCHRLAEFMDTIYSDEAMIPLIDTTYAEIEQDALRDWRKHGWERSDWFTGAPDAFKAYISGRRDFLRSEMPGYRPADSLYLKINEVMVNNETVLEDPDETGEFPAWFEIYNEGLEETDLSGVYLTNDLSDPTRFQVPNGVVVPAGGFLTFYADDDPEQGPWHTNFTLGVGGGEIGIFLDSRRIDAHTVGAQAADVSEGRYPDGGDNWILFSVPKPGASNLLLPPSVDISPPKPLLPDALDPVDVVATIVDDGAVVSATLHYRTEGSDFVGVPMANVRGDLYAAQIPSQPDGSLVEYYVSATDNGGWTGTSSSDVAGNPCRYVVGYRPPMVFINEFGADNEATLSDEDEPGEFPDWIELYNPGSHAVDLGGRYLSDDLGDPTRFRIADGVVIPAGGFLLFYADNDPEQGSLHTNFRLNRGGESVGLFDIDANANRPIDTYTFGPQFPDVSQRRYPNGGPDWILSRTPTPGRAGVALKYLPMLLKRTMR